MGSSGAATMGAGDRTAMQGCSLAPDKSVFSFLHFLPSGRQNTVEGALFWAAFTGSSSDFAGVSWGPLPERVPLAGAVAGLKMERDPAGSELPRYQQCCSAQLGACATLADSKLEVKFQKTGKT